MNGVDVVIVGSGLMGAAMAAQIRELSPNLSIVMVDAGTGDLTPGLHLHDVDDPALRSAYLEQARSGVQSAYGGATRSGGSDGPGGLRPGMQSLQALGHNGQAMPGASLSWNAGGMGVHWTAATPLPWGHEVFDFGDPAQWKADLTRAHALLRVDDDPYPDHAAARAILTTLAAATPAVPEDRTPRPMPMAVQPGPYGLHRTSPGVIFPPISGADDPLFSLLTGTAAVQIVHRSGVARAVRVADVTTGRARLIPAGVVVVCADTFRTPQLLHASGIRPAALGRYLNEHAMLSGRVLVDHHRLGFALGDVPHPLPGEWNTAHSWIPHADHLQPFHWQVMQSMPVDPAGRRSYLAGLSAYIPTEIRPSSCLRFDDEATDTIGLPRIHVEFAYTDGDLAAITEARRHQFELAGRLGPFDPVTESLLLEPGGSLHFTGTVRVGADETDSVASTDGRVWGTSNVFVAGNGAVPTALACNSTLTGTITAVMAARGVAESLAVRASP